MLEKKHLSRLSATWNCRLLGGARLPPRTFRSNASCTALPSFPWSIAEAISNGSPRTDRPPTPTSLRFSNPQGMLQ